MCAEPHPGWAIVHERISINWAILRQRVAEARLTVGTAAPALTEEQYGAFVRQQITMISECSHALVAAAARLGTLALADLGINLSGCLSSGMWLVAVGIAMLALLAQCS